MEILSQNGAAFNEIRSQISSLHEDNDKGSAKAANLKPQGNTLETTEDSIYIQRADQSDLRSSDVFEARTDRVSTPLHTELNPENNNKQSAEEQTSTIDNGENTQKQENIARFQEQLLAQKAKNAYTSQSKVAQWSYKNIFQS